jgi:Fe-S-cluster-containing hydrogenase component 2
MVEITIDADVCHKDGLCAMTCTYAIFKQEENDTIPKIDDVMLEKYYRCGHCVAICPHGAISHNHFPEGIVSSITVDRIAKLVSLPETPQIFGALAMGYPRLKFKKWPERNPAKKTWV